MGATTFIVDAKGKTATEAFKAAREAALKAHGDSGYTGTIAEKYGFVMITVPRAMADKPDEYADLLMYRGDSRIKDKWGPCGCIDLGQGEYLFFGWASS